MLQLVIDYKIERDALTLSDNTPAYSPVLAPGGYGGLNPLRNDVALYAVLGRQVPGSFRFSETIYPVADGVLNFQLPSDGLYFAYVYAVSRKMPVFGAPVGTTFVEQGQVFFLDKTMPALRVLDPLLSFEALREFTPELAFVADALLPIICVSRAQQAVDKLLLEYARQGSRNRPQRGEDYSAGWLLAQATLSSVESLHKAARYPEAATQLAALNQQLSLRPADLLPPTGQHTDWLAEQTA